MTILELNFLSSIFCRKLALKLSVSLFVLTPKTSNRHPAGLISGINYEINDALFVSLP